MSEMRDNHPFIQLRERRLAGDPAPSVSTPETPTCQHCGRTKDDHGPLPHYGGYWCKNPAGEVLHRTFWTPAAPPAEAGTCLRLVRVTDPAHPRGWRAGVCEEPMPCRHHPAPAEEGTLREAVTEAGVVALERRLFGHHRDCRCGRCEPGHRLLEALRAALSTKTEADR